MPACHVPSPALIRNADGSAWLVVFYAWQIGGEPYDYRYDRSRYARQPVKP